MKRKMILLSCGVLSIVAGMLLATGLRQDATSGNKLTVVASFYPLYDFAKEIGGNHISISNSTPAGAEPHDYEPSPRSIAQSYQARVFIYNGSSFEPWTERFVRNYRHTAVRATANLELESHDTQSEHNHDDPHAWLDPVLAQKIVTTIRDGLIKADPVNRSEYQKNADQYIAKLSALDKAYKEGLSSCALNTVIASHNALGYLAKRYDFEVAAITGLSPDQEPSAKKIAELSNLARREGVQHILFEHLVSPQLAATIAQEAGAQTLAFDPIEGLTNESQKQGKNYLSLQYENLATLRTALACQ